MHVYLYGGAAGNRKRREKQLRGDGNSQLQEEEDDSGGWRGRTVAATLGRGKRVEQRGLEKVAMDLVVDGFNWRRGQEGEEDDKEVDSRWRLQVQGRGW